MLSRSQFQTNFSVPIGVSSLYCPSKPNVGLKCHCLIWTALWDTSLGSTSRGLPISSTQRPSAAIPKNLSTISASTRLGRGNIIKPEQRARFNSFCLGWKLGDYAEQKCLIGSSLLGACGNNTGKALEEERPCCLSNGTRYETERLVQEVM